jgi:hypothetical protein
MLAGCGQPTADPSGASPPESQPVVLLYRWRPGEHLCYRLITKGADTDQVGRVTGSQADVLLGVDLTLDVVRVAPGGEALLDARVAHCAMRCTGQRSGLDGLEIPVPVGAVDDMQSFPVGLGGQTVTEVTDDRVRLTRNGILVGDTRSRSPIARGVGEAYRESLPRILGSRAEITHGADGRSTVGKRSGGYFAVALADGPAAPSPVALLGLVAPERPVRPGDAWRVPYRVTRLGDHEVQGAGLEGEVTFRLLPDPVPGRPGWVRVAVSDCLRLRGQPWRVTFHLLGQAHERELRSLQRTSTGEVLFDPAAGRVMAAKLRARTDAEIHHLTSGGEALPHVSRSDLITEITLLGQ